MPYSIQGAGDFSVPNRIQKLNILKEYYNNTALLVIIIVKNNIF